MDLVMNDIRVGDIYEHWAGGFYVVSSLQPKVIMISGRRVNDVHSPPVMHQVSDIKNF